VVNCRDTILAHQQLLSTGSCSSRSDTLSSLALKLMHVYLKMHDYTCIPASNKHAWLAGHAFSLHTKLIRVHASINIVNANCKLCLGLMHEAAHASRSTL
jgi:hypothetical protein